MMPAMQRPCEPALSCLTAVLLHCIFGRCHPKYACSLWHFSQRKRPCMHARAVAGLRKAAEPSPFHVQSCKSILRHDPAVLCSVCRRGHRLAVWLYGDGRRRYCNANGRVCHETWRILNEGGGHTEALQAKQARMRHALPLTTFSGTRFALRGKAVQSSCEGACVVCSLV
jgi:hypothetical protein